MSQPVALGLIVAFTAGLLSFLSPCVLPLVPSYLGFLTGMSLPETGGRRWTALLHALLFVAGFSLVFILLGASATALGRALNYYQIWLQRLGGIIVIGFGLVSLGAFAPGLLTRERRLHLERKPVGYLGSALVGMAFAAGWTPCIGPVLGGILGLAATTTDLSRGMLLLGFYSAGLALPFVVAAVALESFLEWFQRFRRFLPWVMRASGILLVLVGILLVSGEFTRLAGWLQGLTPEALRGKI
ncbi:MAG TPA: cytochrome c biogenesis protein CcdA [Gemmatimonadales bacterium]|jgi:cytochrome c-type biogenesis protein|nr:cytochrome c biogenesis protein CcdA [Gemmatimonadales bacterium]